MCRMQRSRSNFFTGKRIERTHDGLWARGAGGSHPAASASRLMESAGACSLGKMWLAIQISGVERDARTETVSGVRDQ